MDNDEGDVSRRETIAAGTAHDTRNLARVKRHPRLLFRGIQLSLEHGVKFHEPRFITLFLEREKSTSIGLRTEMPYNVVTEVVCITDVDQQSNAIIDQLWNE